MNIQIVDLKTTSASQNFSTSLRETGFAILKNHGISYDLTQEIFEEWAKFFESAQKFSYLNTDEKWEDYKNLQGYFPFGSENAKGHHGKNLMEYYHHYKHFDLPQGINPKTMELFGALHNLMLTLLGWLETETPPEIRAGYNIPLPKMLEKEEGVLMRFIHYPPLMGDEKEGDIRAAEHEDINLLTLLLGASTPGLQVKDQKGNWHDVTCDPETIVVNAGDMLQMATQGLYLSTTHRVLSPVGKMARVPRYSMPFFASADHDIRLSKDITARKYLFQRLIENGVRQEEAA